MKKQQRKEKNSNGIVLIVPIVLIFCILGAFVFHVAGRISREMSAAAIDNLSESLDLIRGTIEAILEKEAEFQKLIAREIELMEEPEEFIQSYNGNETMVKVSLVSAGKVQGVTNMGGTFDPEELDFSGGKVVEGLPVSESYVNHLGAWAYTLKCPVIQEKRKRQLFILNIFMNLLIRRCPTDFTAVWRLFILWTQKVRGLY